MVGEGKNSPAHLHMSAAIKEEKSQPHARETSLSGNPLHLSHQMSEERHNKFE